MKPFSKYTDEELVGIKCNEELADAIKLEAIERGIKPPIPLSEALRKSEWHGYQIPGEHVEVFMFCEGYHQSGFGYMTKERAEQAIEGIVRLENRSYGPDQGWNIKTVEPEIRSVYVGVSKARMNRIKFEEYFQDDTDFDKLSDECMEKYRSAVQSDYNRRVHAERKLEYIRLANGDESIARAFWAKAERVDWPE